MRIYLIRHGQTDSNLQGISQGHADVPLNATGHAQARAIAGALAERPIAHVYSSPLMRATEAAGPLAEALMLPIVIERGLIEMDQGELEGLSGDQMAQRYPDFVKAWVAGEAAEMAIPGGESLAQVQQRMNAVLEGLEHRHGGEEIAVVSHNLALKTYLCAVGGVDLRDFRDFVLDPGGYCVVRVSDGGAVIERVNEVPEAGAD